MKQFVNLPCLLLFSYVVKVLITGASIGDAIALLGVSSLCGYFFYLEDKKELPVNEQVKKQIEGFKLEIETIKSTVNSFKIASTFRR